MSSIQKSHLIEALVNRSTSMPLDLIKSNAADLVQHDIERGLGAHATAPTTSFPRTSPHNRKDTPHAIGRRMSEEVASRKKLCARPADHWALPLSLCAGT